MTWNSRFIDGFILLGVLKGFVAFPQYSIHFWTSMIETVSFPIEPKWCLSCSNFITKTVIYVKSLEIGRRKEICCFWYASPWDASFPHKISKQIFQNRPFWSRFHPKVSKIMEKYKTNNRYLDIVGQIILRGWLDVVRVRQRVDSTSLHVNLTKKNQNNRNYTCNVKNKLISIKYSMF